MPTFITDIVFWIAVFIGLFFILRYFQSKKTKDEQDRDQ